MTRSRKTTAAQLESLHVLRGLTVRSHALLAGRGAAGIQAVLQVLGFRDRPVLIPANTCYIVLWAVLRAGNRPYLVDVDPHTGNVTPETLTACNADGPAAVIPCHLYGLPAPMTGILAWARERSVFVLEDAALALGATVEDRPAGAWGDASIFSFGLGKIVDAEVGGALLTDDSRLALESNAPWLNSPCGANSRSR
jgi:dTDP-4-amino-4,6-dideoxyglucose